MPSVRLVTEAEASIAVASAPTAPSSVWRYIAISAVLLGIIGTWLVWFSASQHLFRGIFKKKIFEQLADEPCRTRLTGALIR
jgi:hypothetical protein